MVRTESFPANENKVKTLKKIWFMNQLGQTVKMREIEGQYQMINMENLLTGNYFLRIVSANNASIPVKISKM